MTDRSSRGLAAIVEPLPVFRDSNRRVRVSSNIEDIIAAVAVASALGVSSVHTWLKLLASDYPAAKMAATSLPPVFRDDPGPDHAAMIAAWRNATDIPNVRGLVAWRSFFFPPDGDVEEVTGLAVEIVHGAGS